MARWNSPLGLALRMLQIRGAGAGYRAHTPGPYVPVTETLTLPDTRVLRIRMDGQDATGAVCPVYNWNFASSDETVFSIEDTEDARIKILVPGPDLLLSGLARSGTLTVTGTPDDSTRAPTLLRTFTINVVPVDAPEISLYQSINGGAETFIGDGYPFTVPINLTATVRMALLDRKGRNVVPTNVVWDDGGASEFHLDPTADPQIVTLVPDEFGLGFGVLTVSCDILVASETVHLERGNTVNIIASAATQLAGLYDIEHPA